MIQPVVGVALKLEPSVLLFIRENEVVDAESVHGDDEVDVETALAAFGNDDCESERPELLVALYRIDAQGALSLKRTSSPGAGASLLIDLNADEIPEAVTYDDLRGFGEYGSFLIQEVREAYNGFTC